LSYKIAGVIIRLFDLVEFLTDSWFNTSANQAPSQLSGLSYRHLFGQIQFKEAGHSKSAASRPSRHWQAVVAKNNSPKESWLTILHPVSYD
jgi:hypothetical protein